MMDAPRWPDDPTRPRSAVAVAVALTLAALGVGLAARPALAQVPAPAGFEALDPTAATAGAKLVVDLRPAELVRTVLMRAVLTQLPADTPSEVRALASGAIEQVLVLVGDRPGPPPADEDEDPPLRVTVLLRANRAYDWKAFPSGPGADVTNGGITYRRREGDGPSTICYRALDDRTLLIASEADIAAPLLAPGAAGGPHAWDDAWRRLPPGTTRLALDASWFRAQAKDPREALDAETVAPVAPLIDRPRAYTLTLSDADGPGLDFVALCPDEAAAGAVADCLGKLLDQARAALPGLRRDLGGPVAMIRAPQYAALFAMVERTVAGARVERSGSDARLSAEFEGGRTAALAVGYLIATIPAARESARRMQSANNLKQIGLAFHNYLSVNGAFPPAVVLGPDGKTPHSWRVEILPYLEEGELFREYKLDEPWDGPNNLRLVARMPKVFRDPEDRAAAPGASSYFVPTGPATCFVPGRARGMHLAEFRDGTSTTIMAFEARRDIPWTRPDDVAIDPDGPPPPLGGSRPGGFQALFADGRVRLLRPSIDPKVLKALLTPNGAEVVEADDF